MNSTAKILNTEVTPYYTGSGTAPISASGNPRPSLCLKSFIRHVHTSKRDYGNVLANSIIAKGVYREDGWCWNFISYLKRYIISDTFGRAGIYFAPSKKMLLDWLRYSGDIHLNFDVEHSDIFITEIKESDRWTADDLEVAGMIEK